MAEQIANLNKGEVSISSTSKRAIGVWVDGKTKYIKEYAFTMTSPTTGDYDYVIDTITNIDTLIELKGALQSPNNYEALALGTYHYPKLTTIDTMMFINSNTGGLTVRICVANQTDLDRFFKNAKFAVTIIYTEK